nr:MAG TPA: helix-turn-helix domain protein [Caudoviricetes sp.]
MTNVGSELRKYFESKGITQQSIANQMNVSKAYVNRLFTGKASFGKEVAEKWSNQFGLSKSWLLTGEGSMLSDSTTAPAASSSTDLSSALSKAMDEIAAQRRLTEKSQQQIDRLLSLLEADRRTSAASPNAAAPEEGASSPYAK